MSGKTKHTAGYQEYRNKLHFCVKSSDWSMHECIGRQYVYLTECSYSRQSCKTILWLNLLFTADYVWLLVYKHG